MSSQAGEFSCVEISWEESSTKCKNVYGVVEEPRDERIIPIKIDRGISIHTASDEEDEPFWVVESVKKHEEVRNEIKKMKEEKVLQQSSSVNNYDEEDDNSLTELLKRVQKQRNDLEDILEKENNYTEKTVTRSNSVISEVSTYREKSVSRLSSLEENIKIDESSNNLLNIQIKNKKEFSSITENTSEELMANIIDNLDGPKISSLTGNLSTGITEKNSSLTNENLDEDSILNTPKRVSISRLSSKENCDNFFLPQKITEEYSEKSSSGFQKSILSSLGKNDNSSMPKKQNKHFDRAIRRSLSNEHSTQDIISETSIPSDTNQSESNNDNVNENKTVSKSPLRNKYEHYEKTPYTINDIPNDKSKTIAIENLIDSDKSLHFKMKNDELKSNIDTTEIMGSNNYELTALQKSKADEADFRRKSLIRQSSMLSDALNAMCNENPEDSNYNKQKRLSIKENNTNKFNSNLKEKYENDLSKPSIQESIVKDESQSYLSRKSSISSISSDKNITIPENTENELNKKTSTFITTDIPVEEILDISSKDTSSRSLIFLDNNQKTLNELENEEFITTKKEMSPTKGILENNLHSSHDLSPNYLLKNYGSSITDDEILNDRDLHSAPKLLLQNNNFNQLPEESIAVECNNNNSETIVKHLNPDNLTTNSFLMTKCKDINNQTIPMQERFIDTENSLNNTEPSINDANVERSAHPTLDSKNELNENNLKLKSAKIANKEIDNKSTYGIKQLRGIQNIRCNNNVSVVFYLLFVQKSSSFRLIKLFNVYSYLYAY